jgi:YegS/Rv2252/BmrU family lipid kinase
MSNISGDWLVLINPQAGDNKGLKDWGTVSSLLQEYRIHYHHRFTDYALHGVSLVQEFVTGGCDHVIVVGGDGFLNEIINGLFTLKGIDTQKITIGMIPVGTGNDWFRSLNIPLNYESAVRAIHKGNSCMHDIGKVSYYYQGQEHFTYFINMCGMGFDAIVNRKVNSDKGNKKTGALKYQYHLFTSLVSCATSDVTLTIDDNISRHQVFSMVAGIAQYNGGGMKQLPFAKIDDGLFDVTIITKISKMKIIKNVKHLYDGSFVRLPEVLTFTGKDIRVASDPPVFLEADGESLGNSPFHFEMIPGAIKVITQ